MILYIHGEADYVRIFLDYHLVKQKPYLNNHHLIHCYKYGFFYSEHVFLK